MKKLFLLSASLILSLQYGNCATYYVATTGSNSDPGTNAQPFHTITYAYSVVSAGDVIIVKPGVYTDYTPWAGLQFNKLATANNPITIRSQFKWQAILDGGNISDHTEVMTIYGSYHIIDGFDMRNGFECGVYIAGTAAGNQLLNNNIHHCGNIGDPNSAAGQTGVLSEENTHDTKYYGNYIHHNGRFSINSNLDHGMYLTGDNETIVNNIVTFNCAYGIHIAGYTTVTNMKVYNNVFAWNGRSGAMIWMDMDGIDIRNNIFYKNAELGLLCYDAHGQGVVIDYNLWYGNPQGTINMTWGGSDVAYTSGNNLINVQPYFMNDTSNYHLHSYSLAINSGIPLNPTVTDDMDGILRPQGSGYDMGAYEFPQNTTGFDDASTSLSMTVNVFPNPSSEILFVNSQTEISEVRIMNTIGQEIYFAKENSAFAEINLDKIPNGEYFLCVSEEKGIVTKKIIVMK